MRPIVSVLLLTVSNLGLNATQPEFEVASIKLARPDAHRMVLRGGPGTESPSSWRAETQSLLALLTFAFHVDRRLISGPSWLSDQVFDIEARVPAGATKDDLRGMLQNLLRQRFHLEAHTHKMEMHVYELVVAKNGPKFKESAPGSAPQSQSNGLDKILLDKDGCPILPSGDSIPMMAMGDCFVVRQTKTPIDWLVKLLSVNADQPVVDNTGLNGQYDFALSYRASGSAGPDKGPTLVEAIQEQLGLKMESRKALVDRVVVDHIEKTPTGN